MIRRVLALLGTRYGIAAVLVLVVMGAVVLARLSMDPGSELGMDRQPRSESTYSAVPNDVGDDGVTRPSPSRSTSEGPAAPPSVAPGADGPAVVATKMAEAWVKHDGVSAEAWRNALGPFITPALAAKLREADPTSDKPDKITGSAVLGPTRATTAEVSVPLQSGVLRLRLLGQNGRWLVDAIDWGPA